MARLVATSFDLWDVSRAYGWGTNTGNGDGLGIGLIERMFPVLKSLTTGGVLDKGYRSTGGGRSAYALTTLGTTNLTVCISLDRTKLQGGVAWSCFHGCRLNMSMPASPAIDTAAEFYSGGVTYRLRYVKTGAAITSIDIYNSTGSLVLASATGLNIANTGTMIGVRVSFGPAGIVFEVNGIKATWATTISVSWDADPKLYFGYSGLGSSADAYNILDDLHVCDASGTSDNDLSLPKFICSQTSTIARTISSSAGFTAGGPVSQLVDNGDNYGEWCKASAVGDFVEVSPADGSPSRTPVTGVAAINVVVSGVEKSGFQGKLQLGVKTGADSVSASTGPIIPSTGNNYGEGYGASFMKKSDGTDYTVAEWNSCLVRVTASA